MRTEAASSETLFGIDARERNFVRIKLATNADHKDQRMISSATVQPRQDRSPR